MATTRRPVRSSALFGSAASHLLGMVNRYHDDQDRFLFQCFVGSLSEAVGVSGDPREVFSEGEGSVGVDEVDTIANLGSRLREVAALDPYERCLPLRTYT